MPINTTPVNNEEEKVNKFYTAINHYALEQRKKIEHEKSLPLMKSIL